MILIPIILVGSLHLILAVKPPGYVEKPKIPDPNPPKYDFGYTVDYKSGNKQGHLEQRDGEHTSGHYYVDLPQESTVQEVQYLADDWGFHPVVQYSSKTEHGSFSTRFALGQEAVKQLSGNTFTSTINKNIPTAYRSDGASTSQTVQFLPTVLTHHEPQPQTTLIQHISKEPNPVISTTSSTLPYHAQISQHSLNDGVQYASNIENQHSKSTIKFQLGQQKHTASPQNSLIYNPTVSNQQQIILQEVTTQSPVTIQHQIDYGLKLVTSQRPNVNLISTTATPILNKHKDTSYSKLVASTQNLVSNEDLLKINGAEESNLFIGNEGDQHLTVSGAYGKVVNHQFKKPSGAGIISIESPDEDLTLSQPIVVADIKSDIGNVVSTTEASILYQSSTEGQYADLQSSTPRQSHVSQKFLAPITAGLRLVNSNKVDYLDCQDKNVKHVEDEVIQQENDENNRVRTVVELYKSEPIANIHVISNQQVFEQVKSIQPQVLNEQKVIHKDALESSKKIQENLNQQLYQLGAQQILIHPTEQVNQFEAQEISQQIEEHEEEKVKQHSISSSTISPLNKGTVLVSAQINHNDQNSGHVQYEYGGQILQEPTAQLLIQPENAVYATEQSLQESESLEQRLHTNHQHAVTIQHPSKPQYIENNVYHTVPIVVEKPIEKPIPYPVETIIEKHVPVPYEVRKEVPVPIHIETKVPVPYPVEKKIAVPVEKIVEKPVEITKYIEKPYPVEVKVPQPIPYPVHVHHAVPVNRYIEKQVPYPVEVEKVIEKQIPVQVPYPVEKIVERVVEKPVTVTQIIEKPYPVEKPVPYPVEIPRIIEKKVPYPVEVKVPYKVPNQIQTKSLQEPLLLTYPVQANVAVPLGEFYLFNYNNDWSQKARQNNLHETYPKFVDSYYRRPPSSYGGGIKAQPLRYSTLLSEHKTNSYVGPVPLKTSSLDWGGHKYRGDRNGRGIRLEYGFKPPLIPSIEIDLNGKPIKKNNA